MDMQQKTAQTQKVSYLCITGNNAGGTNEKKIKKKNEERDKWGGMDRTPIYHLETRREKQSIGKGLATRGEGEREQCSGRSCKKKRHNQEGKKRPKSIGRKATEEETR